MDMSSWLEVSGWESGEQALRLEPWIPQSGKLTPNCTTLGCAVRKYSDSWADMLCVMALPTSHLTASLTQMRMGRTTPALSLRRAIKHPPMMQSSEVAADNPKPLGQSNTTPRTQNSPTTLSATEESKVFTIQSHLALHLG